MISNKNTAVLATAGEKMTGMGMVNVVFKVSFAIYLGWYCSLLVQHITRMYRLDTTLV